MAGKLAETGEHEGIVMEEYGERTDEKEKRTRERSRIVERIMGHLKVLRGGEGSSTSTWTDLFSSFQHPVLIRLYLSSLHFGLLSYYHLFNFFSKI